MSGGSGGGSTGSWLVAILKNESRIRKVRKRLAVRLHMTEYSPFTLNIVKVTHKVNQAPLMIMQNHPLLEHTFSG